MKIHVVESALGAPGEIAGKLRGAGLQIEVLEPEKAVLDPIVDDNEPVLVVINTLVAGLEPVTLVEKARRTRLPYYCYVIVVVAEEDRVRALDLLSAGADCVATADELAVCISVGARIAKSSKVSQPGVEMSSLGTLSAGIAHEINNPLAFLLSNLGYVESSLGALREPAALAGIDLGHLEEALRDVRDGAQRISTIVRGLQVFASPEAPLEQPIDLGQLVESVVRPFYGAARGHTRLHLEIATDAMVRGGQVLLEQVIANLVGNALQAMPTSDEAKNRVYVRLFARDNGQIVLEVEDNGVGMASAVIGAMFDPFYTTRPVGQGTGLGLYICKAIVSSMRGHIDVDSELGRGTRMRVVLPGVEHSERQAEFAEPTIVMDFSEASSAWSQD
ncbi:MAG: HAMP domain-containing histidine kinase [Bradymonadaceae bacterium]|nr:HAMP domain-containing histidine kinase [Lujinxingiaceae bacterium]